MTLTNKKFWIVLRDPTKTGQSYSSPKNIVTKIYQGENAQELAVAEASRLARTEGEFYVMESILRIYPSTPPVEIERL